MEGSAFERLRAAMVHSARVMSSPKTVLLQASAVEAAGARAASSSSTSKKPPSSSVKARLKSTSTRGAGRLPKA